MKNVTLFAAALASVSFAANAQTINSSWVPAVGFSQTYNVVTLNGSLSPGAAGSAQTWNFSGAASDSSYTENALSSAAAAGGSNFPSASYALQYTEAGTPAATFFVSSTSLLQVIGTYAGSDLVNVSANFNEPLDVMRFPANFGDAFVDSFHANFTSSLGLNFSFAGNANIQIDGSGSLTTPAGTFNNVLRLKSIQDYAYIGLPPSPGSSTTGVTTSYMWVSPDYPGYSLMSYSIDVAGTSSDTSVSYTNPNSVGIADATNESLQISPNPANDLLTVSFPTGAELSRVELLDLSGRIIATENINGKSNRAILSTSAFTSGMYILRAVDTKGAAVTSKVMVAH